MRIKTALFIVPCLIFLAAGRTLQANELQRLVFNAAGNIGLAAAFVEVQGVTPGNSENINRAINTAITMLNQLISQYNDPPFDSDLIRKIVDLLQRFPRATDRRNNREKMTYLQTCYSNLKSAMSTIFRSDHGLQYSATCDTFVTDLGYYCGQAMAGILLNNRDIEDAAKSRINLALSSGTRTRATLGCSFLSADQARNLGIQNLRTSAEFTAVIVDLENIIRVASLNMEPGFDSPATKGTMTATNRANPPPPAEDRQAGIRLVGRWMGDRIKGPTIHFVQEGPKIRGYFSNLDRYRVEDGYRENEMIMEVTRESDRKYSGSFLYKHIFRGQATVIWRPARIELADTTSGAGTWAHIIWLRPSNPTNINPEESWNYYRVQ